MDASCEAIGNVDFDPFADTGRFHGHPHPMKPASRAGATPVRIRRCLITCMRTRLFIRGLQERSMTEVAADSYTAKTYSVGTYAIRSIVEHRNLKQVAGQRGVAKGQRIPSVQA